jgi:thermopsin
MTTVRRLLWVALIAAVGILAVPLSSAHLSDGILPTAPSATTGLHGPTGSAAGAGSASARLVHEALTLAADRHLSPTRVLLPDFSTPRASVRNGVVTPLYTSAPAPMGLGYFGVQNVSGVNVGSVSYTQSIEGAATINSVDPLYLASSSPDYFTLQLNTVLTHVDVLGNKTGEYWIQNVPVYQASTQTLSIEDNIWNFSSMGAGMYPSTLYSYNGYVVAPTFYYAVGPTWHMPTPFTVQLYNNATVLSHRATVFFNYTITTSNGSRISGSYDQVEFNSVVPGVHTPTPAFQINGKQFNPAGLLNDAEIMLGGPGGGSTTTLLGINASMGLWTLNRSGSYVPVPAGYSFGTDTGETSEGIGEWTNGGSAPLAFLDAGPSILQPLWGLAGVHPGLERVSLTLSPSNAFVFASLGSSFDNATAAWAPVPPGGTAVYNLAPGSYSFRFLLSDYAPGSMLATGPTNATLSLHADASLGVYTPLWAWDDAQVKAISISGVGTVHHPFVLDNRVVGPIDPLFGEVNDYFYPVFPGVFLANTNVHVSVEHAPTFAISYALPSAAASAAYFGLPFSNNLQLEFYNTTDVALADNALITGWFIAYAPYMSNVLFWNSSHALVAGNTFGVQSTGLILFGGSNNTIWGNTFDAASTTATQPFDVLNSQFQNGLQLYEDHDLVYNNVFDTPLTAVTPPFNFYSGAFTIYADSWNVAKQAATDVRVVDGFALSGNILGGTHEGGNFWQNYGTPADPYGVLPYDNGGYILVGGDHFPLTPSPLYRIVFRETGLPNGTAWSVDLNGYNQSSSASSMLFWEPNGTYAYTVGGVAGFTVHGAVGGVLVSGKTVIRQIRFT